MSRLWPRVPPPLNSASRSPSKTRAILKNGAIFCALLLASAHAAMATDATLIGDAHVNSGHPTVNYGSLSNVDVASGATGLVQFDLSGLPSGVTPSQIGMATLRLYVNRVSAPGTVNVAQLAGPWSEMSVTFTTLPALGSSVGSLQVTSAGTVCHARRDRCGARMDLLSGYKQRVCAGHNVGVGALRFEGE